MFNTPDAEMDSKNCDTKIDSLTRKMEIPSDTKFNSINSVTNRISNTKMDIPSYTKNNSLTCDTKLDNATSDTKMNIPIDTKMIRINSITNPNNVISSSEAYKKISDTKMDNSTSDIKINFINNAANTINVISINEASKKTVTSKIIDKKKEIRQGSVTDSFKSQWLNTTLKFAIDDIWLVLKYPEMSEIQAVFLYSLILQIQSENSDMDVNFGDKTLCMLLRKAVRALSVKFEFNVSISNCNTHTRCVILQKIPRPLLVKTSSPEVYQQDVIETPKFSYTKKQLLSMKIEFVVGKVSPDLMKTAIESLIMFFENSNETVLTFTNCLEEQLKFIKLLCQLRRSKRMENVLPYECQDLFQNLKSAAYKSRLSYVVGMSHLTVTKVMFCRKKQKAKRNINNYFSMAYEKKQYSLIATKKHQEGLSEPVAIENASKFIKTHITMRCDRSKYPLIAKRTGPFAVEDASNFNRNPITMPFERQQCQGVKAKKKLEEGLSAPVEIENASNIIKTHFTITCKEKQYPLNEKKKLLEGLSEPVAIENASKIMKRMGWMGGPLGKNGQGIAEPIKPSLNPVKRAGFGASKEKESKRVCHCRIAT